MENFGLTVCDEITKEGVCIVGNELVKHLGKNSSVKIPNSVTTIGEKAFYECEALTSVVIPNGVTTIGNCAFKGSVLQSIFIPSTVSTIETDAFCNCSNLESIVVDNNNKVYDSRNNCNALIETAKCSLITGCNTTIIPDGVKIIGKNAFYGHGGITSIDIPNGVTDIEEGAFSYTSLTSIIIPNSVTSIDKKAFKYCYSLKSIIVEEGNPIYDSRDDCNALIETATNSLIKGCNGIKIPDGIKTICDDALYYYSDSFKIPSSVTTIEKGAFYNVKDVYVYHETPIQLVYGAFSSYNNLHVLKGTRDLYNQAINWRLFNIIDDIPLNNTSINSVAYEDNINSNVYTLDGRLTDNNQKAGIYIKNGKKVIIR